MLMNMGVYVRAIERGQLPFVDDEATRFKIEATTKLRTMVAALQRARGETRRAFDGCIDAGLRELLVEVLQRAIRRANPNGENTKKGVLQGEEVISERRKPRGRPPLPKKKEDLIVSAVKLGQSFAAVADQFEVSDTTVSKIARAAGLRSTQRRPKISIEKRAQVLAALEHGKSLRAVAREIGGLSYKSVERIAKNSPNHHRRHLRDLPKAPSRREPLPS